MSSSSPDQVPPQAPADPTVASSAGPPPNPPMPDSCPECGQALVNLQDRKGQLKRSVAVLFAKHGSAVAHIITASLSFLDKNEG